MVSKTVEQLVLALLQDSRIDDFKVEIQTVTGTRTTFTKTEERIDCL